MPAPDRRGAFTRPGASFLILLALLALLWLAGGASRADVPGQVVTRAAAALALAAAALFGAVPRLAEVRGTALLLAAAVVLVLLHLAPLPPDLWRALPGRAPLAPPIAGERPWLPLTLNRNMTVNALLSLLVPAAVLVLAAGATSRERRLLLPATIALVALAALFGLFQFSVGVFDNPLLNDTPWQVTGPFANRNHFALFLAIGCLLVPAWSVVEGDPFGWRGAVALGLELLFLLMILATGSRAGLLVGALGAGIGLLLVRRAILRRARRLPRWLVPALLGGIVLLLLLAVLASVGAGRADSIERLFATGEQEDMRRRALPTLLAMLETYFPVGAGIGSFDTAFRFHEPFALLKPTYFNHAHNDLIEIALDAGAPGLLLLLAFVAWLGWRALRLRRAPAGEGILPASGAGVLLLILVASAFDYPARTPLVMALAVIAAVWLEAPGEGARSPLPRNNRHL